MTVIAQDGKTLAADRLLSIGDSKGTITKIFKSEQKQILFGAAGPTNSCKLMANWIFNSGLCCDFPKEQLANSTSCCCIVITADKAILRYSNSPEPTILEDTFCAIGTGRDFALAAMYLGKTAKEAVEVACALQIHCGNGIDTLTLD